MNSTDEQLRYPIGKFTPKESYSTEELNSFIESIQSLPGRIDTIIKKFSEQHYNTPYREGGWTGRQVIHHLADSHMNAFIRIKWALTEETPLIKAYEEKLWAETPENALDPVISMNLLQALHHKWAALLKLVPPSQRSREYIHPATQKKVSIERMMALYSWHGNHHLAHLQIIASKG